MKKDLKEITTEDLIKELTDRGLNVTGFKDVVEEVGEESKSEVEYVDIYYNAIKTPDGSVISSRHRHDYVSYTDKNGQYYSVDGGDAYLRRGFDIQDYEELSIDSNTEFSDIRTKFHWGNRGKDGTQELSYKSLSKMSNSHVEAVLENVFNKNNIDSRFKTWFEKEIQYRKDNFILIED